MNFFLEYELYSFKHYLGSPRETMFHLLPSLYTVLMSVEKRFASTSDWQGSKQGLSLDRAALSSSLRKTNCPSLCKANKDNIISHMTLIRIASSHHHITPLAPLPTPSSHPARQRHIHKGHQNKIAFASWLLSIGMSVSSRGTLDKCFLQNKEKVINLSTC